MKYLLILFSLFVFNSYGHGLRCDVIDNTISINYLVIENAIKSINDSADEIDAYLIKPNSKKSAYFQSTYFQQTLKVIRGAKKAIKAFLKSLEINFIKLAKYCTNTNSEIKSYQVAKGAFQAKKFLIKKTYENLDWIMEKAKKQKTKL